MKKNIILLLLIFNAGFFSVACSQTRNTQFQTTPQEQSKNQSPIPSPPVSSLSGEDTIRIFFNLIDEKRISEAIALLDTSLVSTTIDQQLWEKTFSAFKTVTIQEILVVLKETAPSSSLQQYKVTLNVQLQKTNPDILWKTGENIRWISVVKNDNLWKIKEIATGP